MRMVNSKSNKSKLKKYTNVIVSNDKYFLFIYLIFLVWRYHIIGIKVGQGDPSSPTIHPPQRLKAYDSK